MDKNEAKVQQYVIGRMLGGMSGEGGEDVEIDIFDLLYETSLSYPEAKAVLDGLAAEGKLEARDRRTVRLLAEGWHGPQDKAGRDGLAEEILGELKALLDRLSEQLAEQKGKEEAEEASAADEAEKRRREYFERRRRELIRRIEMEEMEIANELAVVDDEDEEEYDEDEEEYDEDEEEYDEDEEDYDEDEEDDEDEEEYDEDEEEYDEEDDDDD